MNSVERNRRWLARLLDLAQMNEAERGSSAEVLRKFALEQAPRSIAEARLGGPSPQPAVMMEPTRQKPARQKNKKACVNCGKPGVYRATAGGWFCPLHETAARESDADDKNSDALMAELRAANPPQTAAAPTEPARGTDEDTLLFREILDGLNSYRANSEWTFPPLTITPTVTLGPAPHAKTERYMMGQLQDVVLMGIYDLLLQHGHKIRWCEWEDCERAFLSIRRQVFCSKKCAWHARFERFKDKLGGEEGFSDRRHEYYERWMKRRKGKKRVIGRRKRSKQVRAFKEA